MNDLAEKALNGLDTARREVCARPMLSLGVAGFAVACFVVVTGGLVAAARPNRPLTVWLGLEDSHGAANRGPVPGVLFLAGIVVLLAVWVLTAEVVRRTAQPERRLWWVAAAWAAPFALGPPLMDTTVYSYAAFGLAQRHGLDPYDGGPARLGSDAIVAAVDPGSRGTPSGVGPLGTLVQHFAVGLGAGSTLGAVIVLRVVAVLALVAIGRFATELAGPRRPAALTLTVLNPLALLYVVSAAHLDGLMIALVLAAVVAAGQRRWLAAVVLGCLAGSVSAQGFVVLPAILVAHWLGRRRLATWQLLGRDLGVAAATILALGFGVPHGFGWLGTVDNQFSTHTPFSIASAVAKVLAPVVRGASYDDLAAGARITTITAMVCVIAYLIATTRRRSLERTTGYSLLAMALLAPVLYPWYLLWGTLCLAPSAFGSRRIVVFGLCAAGCLLVPPGFSPTTSQALTGAALVVVAALTGYALRRAEQPAPEREPVSAAG